MTTHNTHHEHSDADASVVEQSSVPDNEKTVDSTASETSASPSSTDETNASAEEQTSSVHSAEDHTQEAAVTHISTPEHETMPVSSNEVSGQFEAASSAENSDEQSPSPAAPEDAVAPEDQKAFHSFSDFPQTLPDHGQETGSQEATASASSETVANEVPTDTSTSSASINEAFPVEIPEAEAVQEAADERPLSTDEAANVEPTTAESSEPAAVAEIPADVSATDIPQMHDSASPAAFQEQEQEISQASSAEEDITAEVVVEQPKEIPQPEVTSQAEEKGAEEVRPFTDFIAEFRQAEAALQATLRDTQAEAFSLLSSAAADLLDGETSVNVEQSIGAPLGEIEAGNEDISSPALFANEVQETAPEKEGEQIEPLKEEQKPVTRPVSPLLRPASRLRMPRHGAGRHMREESAQSTSAVNEVSTPSEAPAQPSELVEEQASPRPARRYRFDRPATTSGATPASAAASSTRHAHPLRTTAQKSEEKLAQHARVEESKQVEEQPKEVTQPEVASKKQAEAESTTPVQTNEHGRRRHNKEKEQASQVAQEQTPVVETVAPVSEQTSSVEGVAPEDLPPLEYSELQKASSRRRRRHRSGSNAAATPSNVTATASSGNVSAPSANQPSAPSAPQEPMRPVASNNGSNYSIVSGYTVSQMNQGNEMSGPFMGPDPSPARGSVLIRDGRTTRAEMRPTPPSQLYPPASRSNEGGFSTAAMTQFANIVSQALQLQTDRMVAEFRRMNQTPTNVSVSLPPFPSTERVGVFVDVANLLYSARTLRMGVDFGKLLDFLRGNRRLVRAQAYCPTSPQAGDEQMFLQAVKGLGYRITTKNYKTFSSGAKKADLDLDLCMDVVRLVDGSAVDCIVLVSGDSDFMPMLDYCSDHGVRVEVAAFDEAMSATLRQSCDLFINLSMLDEIRA